MAYDETLAARVRDALAARGDVVERKMFGGLAFMVGGHMAIGVNADTLMVRVGPERYLGALARPHAREMDFTGKPLKGFVYVAQEGVADAAGLVTWLDDALGFVASLPAK